MLIGERKFAIQQFFDENCRLQRGRKDSLDSLIRAAARIKRKEWEGPLFVDTETTGLSPFPGSEITELFSWNGEKPILSNKAEVFLIQLGFFLSGELHIVYAHYEDEPCWNAALFILKNAPCKKVLHNAKFDIQMMCYSNTTVLDLLEHDIYDTLQASYLIFDRVGIRHDLDTLGRMVAGVEHDVSWKRGLDKEKAAMRKREKAEGRRRGYYNYSAFNKDIMIEYALLDIWHTFLVYTVMEDEIADIYAGPFALEMEVLKEAVRMERRGLKISAWKAKCASIKLLKLEKALRDKLGAKFNGTWVLPGNEFNPLSKDDLAVALREDGIADEERINKDGKVSTDKEVLKRLAEKYPERDWLGWIKDVRTVGKLRSAYFDKFLAVKDTRGRVHCSLRVSETATGRFACAEPNLQNTPRPENAAFAGIPTVRGVVIPEVGYRLFFADYSQIEMRVFAMLCQEQAMLTALANGVDLHSAIAEAIYGKEFTKEQRYAVKAINFGIIYGMGLKKLAAVLKTDVGGAKRFLEDNYFSRYPGMKTLLEKIKRLLRKQGYVEDIFGRRYHIPLEKSYIAVNSIVQGLSAGILKTAITQVARGIKKRGWEDRVRLLLPIHDELLMEGFDDGEAALLEDAAFVKIGMECILALDGLGVKPVVEVAVSPAAWERKKDIEIPRQCLLKAKLWWRNNTDCLQSKRDFVPWFLE